MASNFLPVGLLDQPWSEDDSLGTLSSLERRQRKAAEKSDINAFYKLMGIVFVTFNLVLLGSELYTFATEPSRGLTGAFLLEIGRLSGVAYGQMQNLYRVVGDIAWTGIAVVHGHDFAQRGVDVAEGVAKLLACGLVYLAVALTGLIIWFACYGIWRAPLRTILLSALGVALLFAAPQLYEWLVPHLSKTSSAEPVVIWALLFGGGMSLSSLLVARVVGCRRDEGPHAPASPARSRSTAAPRRQPATGSGTSGCSTSSPLPGSSGLKRGQYNRASSYGRSGWQATSGDATQPSVPRSGSSASLSGSGLFAGLSCLSGTASGVVADPVGIHASARGLHHSGSVGNSSADIASSSSAHTKHGTAAPASSAQMQTSRGGSTGNPSGFDPIAVTSKHNVSSVSQGPGSTESSCSSAGISNNSSNTYNALALTKGSPSIVSSRKQRQSGGTSCNHGSGTECLNQTKSASIAGSGSASKQTRGSPHESLLAHDGAGGTSKQVNGCQASKQHESTAPSMPGNASVSNALFSSPIAATAVSKKKSSISLNSGSSSSHAAVPAQSATSNAMSANSAASAANGGASRSARPEVSSSKSSVAFSKEGSVAGAAIGVGPGPTITPAASGAGGLLSRITAAAAPGMAGRMAKKSSAAAPFSARKPQGQLAHTPPTPHYVIVPPPPPPPPRKTQPLTTDVSAPASSGNATPFEGTGVVASAAKSPPFSATRNAWLNPNPVIKQASGVAKGPKEASATVRPSTALSTSSPSSVAGTSTSDFLASRSSGGAPMHFGSEGPSGPPSTRSASYGGAGCAGLSPVDPLVLVGSPHSNARSPMFPSATSTISAPPPSTPPSMAGSLIRATNTISEPLNANAPVAAPAHGVAASAFLPPQAQEQLQNHFQANPTGPGTLISTTIVSTDAGVGPLVAHKHASGDLDIANVAANYRPYPSLSPTGTGAPLNDTESADSFSLFSTPPPLITADVGIDPVSGLEGNLGPCMSAAQHIQYGNHGVYGNYTALPSLVNDPVWGHNVPSVFGAPPHLNGPQASRVSPPPGFPSHAYGGAFATGPIPVTPNPMVTGWERASAVTTAATASQGASDTLPLPPAGESGILASLGFVDEGNNDGASGGGGEDGGASCAICWSAPRQVGFLHGKTSHLCVCRRCAAKLREGVHRCPMCRQLIERIIDIY